MDAEANKPKRVRTPNLEIETHPGVDRIEMDAYVNANVGVTRKGRGLRFSKIIPPAQIGSIDENTGLT